jgi:hypothetical protein
VLIVDNLLLIVALDAKTNGTAQETAKLSSGRAINHSVISSFRTDKRIRKDLKR